MGPPGHADRPYNARMTTATLSNKAQITIPPEVCEALGVTTGDRVEFVLVSPGRYEFIAATRSMLVLKGLCGTPRTPVSIADMNAAVERCGAPA